MRLISLISLPLLSMVASGAPIEGLIAAVVSPFTSDGLALNISVVEAQAAYLEATGIPRVFVAGTTGESLSLTMDERKALVEEWEVVGPAHGINHIVHIGAEAIADVQDLAAHAAAHGAEAVGVMPPVFFKPATIQALGAWVEAAAEACPTLPTYYYHIPSQTGVLFDMYDLVVEMDRRGVSNFAGVKYTGLYETRAFPDLMRAAAYKDGAYSMLGGREELMVEAQAIGVDGFIGSQFNYGGDIYGQIAAETDSVTKNAKQLAGIELLLGWINGVPAGVDGNKMLVNLAGVPVGPARMPSLLPSAADYANLAAVVVSWCNDKKLGGLFDPPPLICASPLLRNQVRAP